MEMEWIEEWLLLEYFVEVSVGLGQLEY